MRNHRPCYQLRAEGRSLNGWRFLMRSKAIFADRETAEQHASEFRELCTDRKFFECAEDNDALKITIEELELFD